MKDPIERQDIIKELESWLKVEGYSEGELNIIKAVLYELQSLPSAQPEKRTEERTETHACDLISRQAAIDALKNQMSDRNDLYNIPVRRSIVILEQLPSAQPERKPGRWSFIGENMFECTSCGVVYTTEQLNGLRNYNTDPYAPRFCPNCGADMRGI